MQLVLSFKKQSNKDIELLKLVLLSYYKNVNDLEDCYVIGDYNQNEIDELNNILFNLKKQLPTKYKDISFRIINTHLQENLKEKKIKIPKYAIIYYQVIEAGKYLKQIYGKCDMLHIHTDVIPFEKLNKDDFNKEYKIKNKELISNGRGWFDEIQLNSIKKFEEIYGKKKMYLMEHHYFYHINDELLKFMKKEEFYLQYNYPDIITNYFVYEKDINIDDMIKENLITTTYKNNQKTLEITDNTKAINITLPESDFSKKVFKILKNGKDIKKKLKKLNN